MGRAITLGVTTAGLTIVVVTIAVGIMAGDILVVAILAAAIRRAVIPMVRANTAAIVEMAMVARSCYSLRIASMIASSIPDSVRI